MRFIVEWTDSALEDLDFFKTYEQTLILDQLADQLRYEPATESRNRKPLDPNPLGEWELRIGAYRVFYNMDATGGTVKITAIGYKEHNMLTIRGREFAL